ncbi:MAG TPA: Hsp20/alpha crystallin family protein [Cyclobacteriaceae bacterium]
MSIIRYNPRDFVPTTFSSLLDKFFDDSVQRSGNGYFVPKVDILENDNAFELHFEAPGMNKEDFNIEVKDNTLTISGERKFSSERKEENYQSIETRYGSFSRSFSLPDSVKSDKINAKYVNGILELTIPKDEKKQLRTSIKVN